MIRLNQNENPFGPSPLARQALVQEIDRLSVYPLPNGEPLTRALSDHCAIEPERIVLSEGSGSISILLAIAEYCTADGGKIVFSEHGYVDFLFGHMKRGGRLSMPFEIVPKAQDGHDLEALAKHAQHPDTRVVILENPDNPTGSWVDRSRFEAFMDAVPAGVVVVMDGAYAEYAHHLVGEQYPDAAALQHRFPNLIGTRTFSKAYGLAGLRVGYAFAAPELAAALNGRRAKLSISAAAIAAAIAALQDTDHLKLTLDANQKQLSALEEAFNCFDVGYASSCANFILFEPLKVNAETFCTRLADQGILVSNMAAYGLKTKVRVNTGTSEQTAKFIHALEIILQ